MKVLLIQPPYPFSEFPKPSSALIFLGTVLIKAKEFAMAGVPVRSVSLIVTDGADMHSTQCNSQDVKHLVSDLQCFYNL